MNALVKHWMQWTAVGWLASMALGFALIKSVHTGPFLSYLFLAVSWPLMQFAENEALGTFVASALAQLAYVGIVVGVIVCVRRLIRGGG